MLLVCFVDALQLPGRMCIRANNSPIEPIFALFVFAREAEDVAGAAPEINKPRILGVSCFTASMRKVSKDIKLIKVET